MAEKIGLQAVFDVQDFEKGLSQYLSGIQEANKATSEGSSQITGLGTAASGTATGGISALGVAVGLAAVEIGKTLVNAIQDAISWIFQIGQDALLTASRFEEMRIAAQFLGQQAGYTEDEVNKYTKAIVEAGIRTDIASSTIAQFSRAGLDLTRTGVLAEIAQGAAILSEGGADSSETLNRLIQSVVTLNPRIARTAGVVANFGAEFDKVAKASGRTADELTNAEKQAAALNAIIESGTPLLGLYDEAMGTAGKQIRSLQGRLIPELLGQLGAPFQDAFFTAVNAVSDFVKALIEAFREGGNLYPILVQLGAVASLVADGFAALVQVATDAVAGFQGEFDTGMMGVVEDALDFGVAIVAALADGIAKAAGPLISGAMQAVQSVLTFWLAPGSPPRVAPVLDQWGADAMTSYLEGFTLADFSVLEDVQGILKKTLSGPDFAAISKDLIGAIGTGGVDESLFQRIAQGAGEFGQQIAELTRRQFALADATEAAAQAQENLDAAQQATKDADKNVRDLVAEYNRLLEAGADKTTLDNQLAQIRAAEDNLKLTQEQEEAAKAAKAAADDQIKPIAEQAKLQELLVKQLMEISKEQEKGRKGGRAGAGRVARPEEKAVNLEDLLPTPEDFAFTLTDTIGAAVDEAKGAIGDKLKEIFKPLTDFLESEEFANLKIKFTELMGSLDTAIQEIGIPALLAFDTIVKSVFGTALETINTQAVPMMQEALNGLGLTMQELNVNWEVVTNAIKFSVEALGVLFTINFGLIISIFTATVNSIVAGAASLIGTLGDILRAFDTLSQGIQTILSGDLMTGIGLILEGLAELTFAQFRLVFGTLLEMVGTFVQSFLDFWVKLAKDLIGNSIIPDMISDIITAFTNFGKDMIKQGENIVKGLEKGWNDMWSLFKSNVFDKIGEFIDWIKRLLGIASPSKVGIAIGRNFGEALQFGLDEAMGRGLEIPPVVVSPMLGSMPLSSSPSVLPQPAPMMGGGAGTPIIIQIGPNTISGDVGLAKFETRVQEAVVKALP